MRYTKSALGLFNAQYRSVLKKCLLINLGLFAIATISATPANAADTVTVLTGVTTTTVENVVQATGDSPWTPTGKTSIDAVAGTQTQTVDVYTTTKVDSLVSGITAGTTDITYGGTAVGTATDIATAIGNVSAAVNTLNANASTDGSIAKQIADATSGMLTTGNYSTTLDSVYAKSSTLKTGATTDVLTGNIADNTTSTNLVTAKQVADYVGATSASSLSATTGTGDDTLTTTVNASGISFTKGTGTPTPVFAVDTNTGTVKANGYDVLTTNSDLNGAKLTAGTVDFAALDSTDVVDSATGIAVKASASDGKLVTEKAVATALAGKQDTINGTNKLDADYIKDGTTNKVYTADEKTKLGGVETGAQVNVIESITVGGTAATVTSKTVALGSMAGETATDYYTKTAADAAFQDADEVKALITAGAGDGLVSSTTGVLAVNVDGSTLEVSSDKVQIKNGGVGENQLAANAVTSAKIADGTITGADISTSAALNVASVTATGTVSAATLQADASNKLTASGLTASAATISGNATVGGTLGVTGAATFDGAVTLGDGSGDAITVNGTATFNQQVNAANGVKVGSATAITSTVANQLNMGGNSLTNVKGLTITDGSTNSATLSVDGTGIKTGNSSLDVGTGSLNGQSLNVGTSDQFKVDGSGNVSTSGSATVGSLQIGSTTYGITSAGVATLGATTVSSLDAGSGLIKTTGKVEAGTLETSGAATIGNKLTVSNGGADITGNTLVKGTFGAGSDGTKFTVDANGNITKAGTVAATGITTTGTTVALGGAGYTTTVTGDAVITGVTTATGGVKFGTDGTAMTGVTRTAVSALAASGSDAKVASEQAVQLTRASINAENATALGALYNYNTTTGDVSYSNAGLAGTNGFDNKATSNDLTKALKSYADNVAAATGVTYAADGTATTPYAAHTATASYAVNTAGTSLKAAIDKVDNAIGDDMTVTGGSRTTAAFKTATTNSVNANLSALDAAIGADAGTAAKGNVLAANSVNANLDLIDTNLGDVSQVKTAAAVTRGNVSNGTTTAPADLSTAVANIDLTLGKIHGLYDNTTHTVNSTTVTSTVNGNSNLANGTTVEDHLVSLDNAVGDRTLTSLNGDINTAMSGTSLAAGLKTAGDKIGDMDFSSTHYVGGDQDLSSAVRTLDSNIYRIDNDVRELKHDFRAGMASMAAMSALVPNPRSQGDTSLSLGTGAYEGHTAMAIGGFHYINDNLMLNAGVSWGNSSESAYRIGVTYSW